MTLPLFRPVFRAASQPNNERPHSGLDPHGHPVIQLTVRGAKWVKPERHWWGYSHSPVTAIYISTLHV